MMGENGPLEDIGVMFCSNVPSGVQQEMLRCLYTFFLLKNQASRDTQNPIQKPLLKC